MKLSSRARELSGARQVTALMAAPRNKELLAQSGLLTRDIEAAGPDDLVVAIDAERELNPVAEKAVLDLLAKPPRALRSPTEHLAPKSLPMACERLEEANLAIISVAGEYAKYEAAQALSSGLDVFLYSDNISLADERALKRLAAAKGLLLMGPDCGSAVIDAMPLGFANRVRQGTVGIISTSGTGLQEVGCLLDRCGLGISTALGVGGRDLVDDIGGISTKTALERLEGDAKTQIIVVIGGDPGAETRRELAGMCRRLGKPVLVRYAGVAEYGAEDAAGIPHAGTLRDAVVMTAERIASILDTSDLDLPSPGVREKDRPSKSGLVRGLFSGGMLCRESAEICRALLPGAMHSNVRVDGVGLIGGHEPADGHVFLDMGTDEFTMGRPHPLLYPEQKLARIVHELCAPEVSVILTDVVLGNAVAPNYAGQLVRAIDRAAALTDGKSREKRVVANVCGTESDTPSRSSQIDILLRSGVTVLGNNARAAAYAAKLSLGGTV
jgi:FdrA protein